MLFSYQARDTISMIQNLRIEDWIRSIQQESSPTSLDERPPKRRRVCENGTEGCPAVALGSPPLTEPSDAMSSKKRSRWEIEEQDDEILNSPGGTCQVSHFIHQVLVVKSASP